MRRLILAGVFLAALAPLAATTVAPGAPPATGGPLDVPAEVSGDPGDWVLVRAETKGKTVKWVALDPGLKVFPPDLLRDSRTAVVVAAQPGRYRLLAYTAVDGEPTDPALATVVIGKGAQPQPQPQPQPGPQPGPPPASQELWLVVVEESGARTPEAARVLADTSFWLALAARGHNWRVYDQDNPAAAERGYRKHADRVGLPALLVFARAGGDEPLKAVRLPATTGGVDQVVKEAGGK